jgi:hypothetical protein
MRLNFKLTNLMVLVGVVLLVVILLTALPKYSHAAEGVEYRVVRLTAFYSVRDIERLLNDQARKGWEYVEHVDITDQDSTEQLYIFKH